jgi:hypothetical protein
MYHPRDLQAAKLDLSKEPKESMVLQEPKVLHCHCSLYLPDAMDQDYDQLPYQDG